MDIILNNLQYLTFLGLLITLTGIYKIHRAVRYNPATKITFHTKEPHDAAIIDFYQARIGLRYTIYGFLIQMITTVC
ncbi:MAG: hypothetical protein JW867_05715 [Candidatus Omnitrophica bacterium]|nr:hypothetical protein [Candidatus Omnitrophota bacterium]